MKRARKEKVEQMSKGADDDSSAMQPTIVESSVDVSDEDNGNSDGDGSNSISPEILARANFEMSLFKGPNVEKLKQEFLDKLFFATNLDLYADTNTDADALEQLKQLKQLELAKLFGDDQVAKGNYQLKWERSDFIFLRASPYFDHSSFFNMHLVSRRVLHHLETQKWKLNARGRALHFSRRTAAKTSEFSEKFLDLLCGGRIRSLNESICCYEMTQHISVDACRDRTLYGVKELKEVKEIHLPFVISVANGSTLLSYFNFPGIERLSCNSCILGNYNFQAGTTCNVKELEVFLDRGSWYAVKHDFLQLEKLTLIFQNDQYDFWCFLPDWTAQHLRQVVIKLLTVDPFDRIQSWSIHDRVKKIFDRLHQLRPDASFTLIVPEPVDSPRVAGVAGLAEMLESTDRAALDASTKSTNAAVELWPSYINIVVDPVHLQSVACRPKCSVCNKCE